MPFDVSSPTDRATGVIADQTIALDGAKTGKDYPLHLRRVRFRDAETRKTLVFLSNGWGPPHSSSARRALRRLFSR
jgi:hypothetical protein